MYKLEATTQFKKDTKSLNSQQIEKLGTALGILELQGTLPFIPYKTHTLKGNYAGFQEAHLEPDCLIIWYQIENDTIKLTRIGSHSKLFKK
ncbi:MAG: type II toxin-antitoxin system YafQ family toxin [Bacteroidales bacterium]|nr:type II toxin-antitoxin system YafQ family toxin [Bacteroidales bacterium]